MAVPCRPPFSSPFAPVTESKDALLRVPQGTECQDIPRAEARLTWAGISTQEMPSLPRRERDSQPTKPVGTPRNDRASRRSSAAGRCLKLPRARESSTKPRDE